MNGLDHDGWIHLGLLTIPKGVLLTTKTGCSNGLNSKARDHRDPCSAGKGRWTHHGGGLRHNHASQHTKNGLIDRPEFRSWWEEIVSYLIPNVYLCIGFYTKRFSPYLLSRANLAAPRLHPRGTQLPPGRLQLHPPAPKNAVMRIQVALLRYVSKHNGCG